MPIPDPVIEKKRQRVMVTGDVPDLIDPPPGCRFASRCPYAQDVCREETPALRNIDQSHFAACHFAACHFAEDIPPQRIATSTA